MKNRFDFFPKPKEKPPEKKEPIFEPARIVQEYKGDDFHHAMYEFEIIEKIRQSSMVKK